MGGAGGTRWGRVASELPFKSRVCQGNFDAAERAYNSALEHEPRNTTAVKEKKQVVAIRALFTRAQTALERVCGTTRISLLLDSQSGSATAGLSIAVAKSSRLCG